MPLTLVLRSSNLDPARGEVALTFDGPRIVLGRGAGCDVRLPDPSVSRRHATVRASGPVFALQDEGSTNGTYLGGARVERHDARVLKTGDLVRIGRVWLEVRLDQTPATRDLATASRDLALALVAQGMRVIGLDPTVTVHAAASAKGPGLRLEDAGRAYVIGPGEDADFRLEPARNEPVTKLQVVRREAAVLVRALEGASAIVLGSAPLARHRDVVWRSGAPVKMGSTTLLLDEPAAAALAELEEQPDEKVGDDDIPPMPGVRTATAVPAEEAEAAGADGAHDADGAEEEDGATPAPDAPRATPAEGWSSLDFAVLSAALVVMALSVAGVFWLLRG